MGKEKVSKFTMCVNANISDVWYAITNKSEWGWRSDLSNVEVEDENNYVEYKKDGTKIEFTVVKSLMEDEYVVKLRADGFKGLWKCYFYRQKNGGTRLEITESLIIKNPIKRIFYDRFVDSSKDENQFVIDLENKFK